MILMWRKRAEAISLFMNFASGTMRPVLVLSMVSAILLCVAEGSQVKAKQCVLSGGMDRELRIPDCHLGQSIASDGTVTVSKSVVAQFEKALKEWTEADKVELEKPFPIIFPDEKSANSVMRGPRLGYVLKLSSGIVIRQVVFFDNGPDYFEEGLARFIARNGKLGFLDEKLKTVLAATYDYATPFSGGISIVCHSIKSDPCLHHQNPGDEYATVKGGKWSVIDKKGKVLKGPGLTQAEVYKFASEKRAEADGK